MTPEVSTAETSAGARLLRDRLRQRSGGAEPAITPAPRDNPPPLSSAQRRLWVVDRLRPDSTEYLVPLVLRLRGDISALDLSGALAKLVGRHEILRTRYPADPSGEPMQVIDPPGPVPYRFDDLTGAGPAALDELLAAEVTRPFDLAAGPVLRARLIRLAPEEHVLAVIMHHIAVDGWSGSVLVRELATLCTGAELPAPALQYADFAAWQHKQLAGARLADGLSYWTEQLRGVPVLELPTDRVRPATWDPRGETVAFEIPAELAARAAALAHDHQATPFMVYLAGFWALLHRYTGQTDFAIGSPIAGRTRSETHGMVGLFVNLLPLRADLAGDPTFGELLDRARHAALDAYAHQEIPFELLVDALLTGRELSIHPLVNVVLTMQNQAPFEFAAGGVTGEVVSVPAQRSKFDLSCTLQERQDGSIAGEVTFPHALLDAATAERMAGHYLELLAGATARPDRRVRELPMLTAVERDALVGSLVTPVSPGPCLHERFDLRAQQHPDAIAVSCQGEQLTYRELAGHANQLAHRLRTLGAGREDRVGVCLPPGGDLVVATLAALKAGAGYLPVDPNHPTERIGFLIRDADARVVVTQAALAPRIAAAGFQGKLVLLDDPDERARLAALPATAPAVAAHPDDLAYVIYTSGSTGQPKGVPVSHANVGRLFAATEPEYGFGPADVWTLFHSYSFDFSVWEMWGALLYGGRLVVVPDHVARSPWDLLTLLADEGVTVLNQTPSAFRSLVELVSRDEPTLARLALRLVIFGGEALDPGMLRPWWDQFGSAAPQLVNMYGITETTVHVTYRPIGPADEARGGSPIGRPIRDLILHLLDERMQPVPAGVPGELYVGGAGVARGYLGLPALTADRFVPDPYGPPGARLYRTGDRARRRGDGEIEYAGRLDDQVKIRGYRIELGEVEACLAGHPDLAAAVVTVHEPAPGEPQLVGYLVPADGAGCSLPDLRAYLADRLPSYLVPAVFVVVPKLPLTSNGKVDRRALPPPDGARPDLDHGFLAPRTPAEEAMAGAWAEVLGTERVGVHDNFFELGGDSIRAVRLVGALRANGFDYSIQDLFRHQSIAELVRSGVGDVTHAERAGTPPFALVSAEDRVLLPDRVVDAYPMAQVQAGMVYELLADAERNLYHNVTSYLIRDPGPFDPAALAAATEALVANHEILRTSFDLDRFSQPLQLVHEQAAAELGHDDLRSLPADRQQARLAEFRDRERARVFDLGTPPLLRVHAHRISDDQWYLSLTECHAILDGWSHNSITTELLTGYRAARDGLPPPGRAPSTVRYADYIAQEQRSLHDSADREFWAGRLAGANRLTIPAAWAEPDAPATTHMVPVPLQEIEGDLRALAGQVRASLKSVLLAAHVAVWRAVAGPEPFYCGLVCNGRTEVAGGDLVRGMFLNPVPFRAPAGAGSWRELIAAVFAEEVELWPHRRFPLPEMQREFGQGERLIEVAFNYLDFHVLDREMVDTAGSTDVSPNEFPMAVVKQGGHLYVAAKSSRAGRRYVEMLAEMYRQALAAMVADPDGRPGRSLLPPAERERLLADGNRTRASVPDRRVHEQVADRAAETPDAVAVETTGGARLTYRELWRRAGAWTARLAAAGVGPGDLVGVCLPREPDLVAAVLGVLATGAAYVPVDQQHPDERIAATLRDAGVCTLLAGPEMAGRLPVGTPLVVDPAEVTSGSQPDLVLRPDPEDLVCVVHTSGSTGKPKGVMVRHAALVSRVESMRRNTRLSAADVVVAIVPMVTDVCQLAMFVALGSGGRLVLAGDDYARDPESLGELLRGSGASFLQASPTTWRLLVESGWLPPAGFRVLSGGERIGADLLRRLRAGGAEVWDMYGPTETTVFCFGTRYSGQTDPPERRGAANTTTYLLDAVLDPVPFGVPGEIFVGGDSLARGYLGQPRATAATFLPDPYAPTPGGRMYATGDLGRHTRDGRIEILGRRDHQLKIRGFRVELGEIEAVLASHHGVRAAVVHPVPGPQGEPQLAAYVILRDTATAAGDLRQFAGRALPSYMVPTHVVTMESFPRLPNGKVDRAALPVPGPDRPEVAAYAAPAGPVEEAIARVWAGALGIERVGRDDDFFALGGHSLLTMRIVGQLRREHGIHISFRDFLTRRTVRGVATAAAADEQAGSEARPPALLWLNERGNAAPLFCVHPGGGSAHWYRSLADAYALGRPLAAFEWPGLHGDHEPPGSVAEIAESYAADLRAARPAGPYHILGWCGSSGIAWEIARHLYQAGERPQLILMDPFEYPTARVNPILANLAVVRRAEQLLARLRDRPVGAAEQRVARAELVAVLQEVVDDGDVNVDETDLELADGWVYRLRTWREMLELRSRYHFPPYPGTVDLITCDALAAGRYRDLLGQTFDEYVEHWRRLAAGGVRVHHSPGDHRTALLPPQVSTLASILADIIDNWSTEE